MPETRNVFKLSSDGTLTTGTQKDSWQAPFACEIVNVTANVGTAPTGAALILDVNLDGTTIFTTQANRPTIPISGTEPAAAAVPDVKTVAAGQTITLDIDQIGSTVAGANLDVSVQYVSV